MVYVKANFVHARLNLPNLKRCPCTLASPMVLVQVIVATNIAETSVTLEGVVYVVDCCYSKQLAYNPWYKPSHVYPRSLAYHGDSQGAEILPAASASGLSACLLVHPGTTHVLHWSSTASFCSCTPVHYCLVLHASAEASPPSGDQAWLSLAVLGGV